MAKKDKPQSKYIKFIAKRKAKKRGQKNDNCFTSAFYPDHKWAVIIAYEHYLLPFYSRKVIGVNWCITKLKKEAQEMNFIDRYPMRTFDTWEEAKEFFDKYRRNIKGDLEKSE